MPFPMKVQPIDSSVSEELIGFSHAKAPARTDAPKPVVKSRLKRLFERQFPNVLKTSSAEKLDPRASLQCGKDAGGGSSSSDSEPSSVCLSKMVINFMEESNEKQITKCGKNRCNCYNESCNDCDDPEFDFFNGCDDPSLATSSSREACETLKSLVTCKSSSERNVLADVAKIVDENKICLCRDDCGRIVADGLLDLGYDASICKSRWEKSASIPSGEYEYIDAIVEGERLLIDIDFRSEFEIARSTCGYKAVLQSLPSIFVGEKDRLRAIVAVVSDAARESLEKEGLHVPPWRKPEYMMAKWLAPYHRWSSMDQKEDAASPSAIAARELELIFNSKVQNGSGDSCGNCSCSCSDSSQKVKVVVSPWHPPTVKPKVHRRGAKIITGLSSALST